MGKKVECSNISNIRVGFFVYECIKSSHTFTGSVVVVVGKGRIDAKERNTRDCPVANQKKRKGKNTKQ